MDNLKEELRQYILSEFLPGESAANLRDDTPLRTSGVLDSMQIVKLVVFLEKRFGIEVDAYEASVQNLDSIDRIATLVERKTAAPS
jgi:acyl carrier protein